MEKERCRSVKQWFNALLALLEDFRNTSKTSRLCACGREHILDFSYVISFSAALRCVREPPKKITSVVVEFN